MAMVDVTINGADTIIKKIDAIENQSGIVARKVVVAGLKVLATAARDASPGTIKRETGFYVRGPKNPQGAVFTWGRAGLIRFPRPGDGQNGPHGVYLELGTKFITARKFIANALLASMNRSREVMRIVANRHISGIAEYYD